MADGLDLDRDFDCCDFDKADLECDLLLDRCGTVRLEYADFEPDFDVDALLRRRFGESNASLRPRFDLELVWRALKGQSALLALIINSFYFLKF